MSLQLPEMPPNKPGLMPPPLSRHALADPRQPPDSHGNSAVHILPVLPSVFHNVLCQTADVFNSPMRHHGRSIIATNAQLASAIPARHNRFQHALDVLEANIITAKMAIHRDYRRRVAERVKREVEEAAEAAEVEKENGETEKAERERAERERLEKEKLEKEKLEKEKLVKEKLVKERLEQEKLMIERLEKERLEREGAGKETLEKEGLEEARSKLEWERAKKEKEQAEKEKADSATAVAGRGAVQQQQLHQELQRQQTQPPPPTLTHPNHEPVLALPQQRQRQGQAATAAISGSSEPQTINGGEQVAENNGEGREEDVVMLDSSLDELFDC